MGPFDVAVTLGTFAHVPDQERFIANIAAALKPSGYLILLAQNRLVYRCPAWVRSNSSLGHDGATRGSGRFAIPYRTCLYD